ncbi:MAG: hypothetical protein AB1815_06930 [Bacillota bacterium]|jgi:hypothetical protein
MGIGPLQPVAFVGLRFFNQLSAGQVARLQLVEHGLNGAIVSLAGKLFRARGALPARAGERFWAVIDSIAGDRIEVRHISPSPAGSRDVCLPDVARVLGLPGDYETEMVLRELLRWRLPLDKNLIAGLTIRVKDLPASERAAYLAAAGLALSLRLPDEPAAREKVVAYLLGCAGAGPEGRELFNQASLNHPEHGKMLALSINGGESWQGQLFLIMPRSRGLDVSEGPVRLILSLTTTAGEIWVDLGLSGKQLQGKVILPDQQFFPLFSRGKHLLEERLTRAGFTPGSIQVEVSSIGSVAELLVSRAEPERYLPLDIRV